MNFLKGKKVLVTVQELEKKEHRGISSYTKSLIKALKKADAEVWLLIGMDYKKINFKEKNRNFINKLLITFSLDYLNNKQPLKISPFFHIFKDKFTFLFKLFLKLHLFSSNNTYGRKNSLELKFTDKVDNPYLKINRTSYLKNIDGFYIAPYVYERCSLSSLNPFKSNIKINLKNFDLLISTAPLNIRPDSSLNNKFFVQTIHDIIPLEYQPNLLTIKIFFKMLKNCLYSNNIFVSETARCKFNNIFDAKKLNRNNLKDLVIYQPPSLIFEEYEKEHIYEKVLNSISNYNNNIIEPFKYFIFNSSIDERKNVSLLIESYLNSNIQKEGIKLIITGKLKNDEYSIKLKSLAKKNKGIILTDYISELQQSSLYLNAISLLSPSLIEGFGIPVLNACCLGLPCYASDCDSHKEILNLYDFNSYLEIYNPNSIIQWTNLFLENYSFDIKNIKQIRIKRLERYKELSNKFQSDFVNQLDKFCYEV